jgi:hypothetical protein
LELGTLFAIYKAWQAWCEPEAETKGNEMSKVTIKQKTSNSGNIHDIASECFDRVIEFRGATKYAVVLASYYGGKGYTTHATEEATCAMAYKMRDYSYTIIDADGVEYISNGGSCYAGDQLIRA